MNTLEHTDQRGSWVTSGLLLAAVLLYIVGPLVVPAGLRDLYELDSVTDKYRAVAADEAAYRWANLAVAGGAALGALAIYRLARPLGTLARLGAVGFAIAVATWLVLSLLRMTLVVGRAGDIVTGTASDASTVTDTALRGDGLFLAASFIAGAALVWLAVAWRRVGVAGWPTTALLSVAGLATVVSARSDPLAIVFISPFPFFLALLPLAVGTLRQARVRQEDNATAATAV